MQSYPRSLARTGVQDIAPWRPETDIQCDFVMVYGTDHLEERIRTWKEHGYEIHLMTGVSWGEYQDYLYGRFDGIDHHDEGQTDRRGHEINHGKDVPYMVPSLAFSHYLVSRLKHAVDCGITSIHLEEPEFWTRAGYSEAFRREWQIYYGEPWRDPATDADAAYRCGKLKQYLYTRMLDRLCSELKEYAMTKYGSLLRFYVPTHSLINYSQWGIVSPESALLDLPAIDGYIAQIWTGTSRTPNCYEGVRAERTFETAFLEYGVMQELVRGTGRRMWFLQDPVEDLPTHTWSDYRYNYYRTLIAALMHPKISDYEVAPWPSRVFCHPYPNDGDAAPSTIPAEYQTNLLTVMQTLRNMNQEPVYWEHDTQPIGVLLADSAMFQRHFHDGIDMHDFDRDWDAFYGLSLPLLKRGLPIRPVQLDNVRRISGYLNEYRILVLSYEFMKPEYPDLHPALAQWVREGGVLIYVGDGSDTFHTVRHWWNSTGASYANPAEHLTETLGLGRTPAPGCYPIGEGFFCLLGEAPTALARSGEKAENYRAAVRDVMAKAGMAWEERTDMILHRGPYVITAVMEDEAAVPVTLAGNCINLLEADLPHVKDPILAPGSVGLWYDLATLSATAENEILAAAARLDDLQADSDTGTLTFRATCTGNSICAIRIRDHRKPCGVSASTEGKEIAVTCTPDPDSSTYLLRFPNATEGVTVTIRYA